MSKKTRKEKILADQRRLRHLHTAPASEFVKPSAGTALENPINQPSASYQFTKEAVPVGKINVSTHDYSYAYKDLIRITIFTLVTLFAQGVLYFVLRR
jgi:hypothetical protein